MRRYIICIICVLSALVVPVLAADEPLTTETEVWSLTDVSVMSVETPVETSEGLKGALLSILGPYDPPVVIYTYTSTNGNINYVREIVPDYPFLAAAAVLLLLLYGLIRVGGMLCRK